MTEPEDQAPMFTSSTGAPLADSEWLDAHFEVLRPEYEDALRWVGIQSGWHVLDAACGSGGYLQLLTELVGRSGHVSAIDIAPEHVHAIQKHIDNATWAAPVNAMLGDLMKLPYDDNSFDMSWCANTLQYLTDDQLAETLRELIRVTKSGGIVAIKDTDLTAYQFQPLPISIFSRWLEAWRASGDPQAHGVSRTVQLWSWLQRAGLCDVRQRHIPMVRIAPLSNLAQKIFAEFMQFANSTAQTLDLSMEDRQIWAMLADSNASDHILKRTDFVSRELQIVFVGRVQKSQSM